ncbi:M48 family metallopeptidase [Nitratireductor pacificus]|uniref:Peptidase M48 Ste24p n=1 Tax=Nitratireductor pacificus pht-3B TaxID=391937 RepID=K2LJG4_9HYPH|nr:M48 family metallopeptidase [Nitratireductor pacificus]EKF17889.1 peptidase M48 Ste24p [Nitratireductor pacificus pht-3B]
MIKGRYFPPGSSRAVDASLRRTEQGLVLARDEEDAAPQSDPVLVSDPLGGVPRKLTFADGGVFEAPHDADIDLLLRRRGGFFARLARLEKSLAFAGAAAVAVIGLLFLIYRFGIPLLAAGAAAVTPPVIVAAMDRGTLETVDRTVLSPTALDEEAQARLHRIFAELVALAEPEGPQLRLLLREGGVIGANALALPGGTIIVTDDLVDLAESDDEIAGVMAHEIGHVRERHSLKQVYRVLGIGFMVGVIGGDAGQLVDDVVAQAAAFQTLIYARGFEADADRFSVGLMVAAGRDPTAFVDLLDRIAADSGDAGETGWLSTHPGTLDRRAAVLEAARGLGWEG